MKFYQRLTGFFVLWLCIGASAMGDDLDIYLGTADTAVTYKPNVMFVMDTSGSMGNKDGTDLSRMERVKTALKTALSSATNLNAGLMRFSNVGGPVLYPARDIDSFVTPEIIRSTASSGSDAYETVLTTNTDSADLVLSQGTSTVTSGIRITNLMIPQGATVTGAYLRLTSSQFDAAETTLRFKAELTADSQPFTATTKNIGLRTTTSNEVVWSEDNAFPLSNEIVVTPDLTSVIQEVVDQEAWCGGNALSIIITGESVNAGSSRKVKAFDSGTNQAPQLYLTYDDATATGCIAGERIYQVSSQANNREERHDGNNSTGGVLNFNNNNNKLIGLRFENVNIPKDAVIESAYLRLAASSNNNYSASMRIRGIAKNNIGELDDLGQYGLNSINKTSSSKQWNVPSFYQNYWHSSPDVSAVIQEIVNRGGWEAGNSLGLVFDNFNGNRAAYTYNGYASGAPQLIISFKGDATPGAASTVREYLLSLIDDLSARGTTPIVDTLLEATNYYGGRDVDYGLTRGTSGTNEDVRRSTRVSHRASYLGSDAVRHPGCTENNLNSAYCMSESIPSGATYISPVSDLQCQTNNHIVLLSDGEANGNVSKSKIASLLGKTCSGSGDETCGLDLVENIHDKDRSVIGRRVNTHTIGFAANSTANNFLNKLAAKGGGGFYKADNSTELLAAFQTILRSVKDVNTTFVSPGVAVNQQNRLTHKDELYFALFKPAEGALWPGNLKRYKLSGNSILDKNGVEAVDTTTGYFSESAHSYWSVSPDGNQVAEGGAASKLGSTRAIYMADGNGTIMKNSNRIHEDNLAITALDLALPVSLDVLSVRESLLQWARGVDILDADGDGSTSDIRHQMGDPIHSQPILVNYSDTDSAILVATNQGYLHSFDGATGAENFAIIPRTLLSNLYTFFENNSTYTHTYGLDGHMVLREFDNKKYLYVGMRRGGRNYYVFDITNKTSPKQVFEINGGSTGVEKLGQTWSKPTITKIKIGGTTRNVMIVGGGYDDNNDTKTTRSDDSYGNAVYIFDADNGSLLWSASNTDADLNLPEMKYSIPGRVSVIDRDHDGLADHMYMADAGGQLFRMDIYNGKSGSDLIKGGRLADFGGSSEQDNRHFYYGPDVSEIALADEHYYAVALGSGWRAAPLDTNVQDRFYMLKDKGVFITDSDNEYTFMPTVTEADLYDVTSSDLTSADSSTRELAATAFAGKDGWFLNMTTGGEKILASPFIIDYKVLFTSYIPAASSQSACAPPSGGSRAYLVNLVNGNAVNDINNDSGPADGVITHEDRYADLRQSGIAPETRVLIEEISKPVVCLGTECAAAAITVKADGTQEDCLTSFACLAENIYGRFERVIHESWKTETERE
ncbi:PilC/PilY family type IV pilus protein [Salinimonas lutimaris]|uniref:PilC/PilY family type IV pilus protein n=1 Tax=Salinimonas lutimaris TaxID=914153 RepID=UPI0010C07A5D|nr:PilC/PilY family type IV pilus protein [Salinimonas lutimaris]